MIYKDPYYFLLFSANGFLSPHYHVGVAKSHNVTGPYTRSDQYVIELDETRYRDKDVSFVSPGHCSVADTPDGDSWLIYHAWHYGQVGVTPPGRVMMLDKICWNEEGW